MNTDRILLFLNQNGHGAADAARANKIARDVPHTDLDVAEWIHRTFPDRLHYTASEGWWEWDGSIHVRTAGDTTALNVVRAYVRALEAILYSSRPNDTNGADDRKRAEAALAPLWAYEKRLKSQAGINSLIGVLRGIHTVPNDWSDQDRTWCVLADGSVLDIGMTLGGAGIDLLAADPARAVTRKMGTRLDGTETGNPEMLLSYLRHTVGTEEEITYLQTAAGAAWIGEGMAKNVPCLIGPPNTFKSAYLRVLDAIFGGYSGTLPAGALVQKYGGGTNFAQSRARGVRLLWLSEPQTTRTDDAFLKNLAGGGEPINTEEKGKDSVAWRAQCVLHIASNHIPKFDTKDNAIVNRMNLVEFNNAVSEKDINPNLVQDILDEEAGEILAWVIEGARLYSEHRAIRVPEVIRKRGQDHVTDSSAPLLWLNELLSDGIYLLDSNTPSKMVKQKEAWETFEDWCRENGVKIPERSAWASDINSFTHCPKGKEKDRPGGFVRLWGVHHAAQRILESAQDAHPEAVARSATFAELVEPKN